MNRLVVVLVTVIVMATLIQTQSQQLLLASHHHHILQDTKKCTKPNTVLYVYTWPVPKECVLLTHNGHAYNANGTIMK